MKKTLFIVLAMIGVGSLCATEPIDDVYYWPEVKSQKAAKTETEESSAPEALKVERQESKTESQKASEPEPLQVEYVNVQDTTVTIRVK